MAVTKTNTYLSLIFIFVIISFLVLNLGTTAKNSSKINLDAKSIEYIGNYTNQYGASNFTTVSGTELKTSAGEEVLTGDNETGEPFATDNVGVPKFTQGSLRDTPNKFKLVFNMPTFMLLGLGVSNIGPFNPYINIIGWIVQIGLLILFVKLVFNGGSDN